MYTYMRQAAIKCYERASALGCVEAKLALGFCYFHGDAVDQNYSKAVECFEEAANLVRPIHRVMDFIQNGNGGVGIRSSKF